MAERYLKQAIVFRKDLTMPAGKLAAMAAHAAMTFITSRLRQMDSVIPDGKLWGRFSDDEVRWLTEIDPGLEDLGQLSFAKIVLAVEDEPALLAVEVAAKEHRLTVHRVTDSGYSHNKPRTFAAIAIGPHWPEQLEPVTGKLKVYR